jgi:hypothetical protein
MEQHLQNWLFVTRHRLLVTPQNVKDGLRAAAFVSFSSGWVGSKEVCLRPLLTLGRARQPSDATGHGLLADPGRSGTRNASGFWGYGEAFVANLADREQTPRGVSVAVEGQSPWPHGARKIASYIYCPASSVYALDSAGGVPVERGGSALMSRKSVEGREAWSGDGCSGCAPIGFAPQQGRH